MNRRQVYFLLGGVCLFALSWFFPAWIYVDENTAVSSAGYHFRYSRPPLKLPNQMPATIGYEPTGNTMHVMWIQVDGVRELGQAVALLFLTLGAILVSVQRRLVTIHIVGWVCVFAGVCVLTFLVFYVSLVLS